jgi:hypothetical protein
MRRFLATMIGFAVLKAGRSLWTRWSRSRAARRYMERPDRFRSQDEYSHLP